MELCIKLLFYCYACFNDLSRIVHNRGWFIRGNGINHLALVMRKTDQRRVYRQDIYKVYITFHYFKYAVNYCTRSRGESDDSQEG